MEWTCETCSAKFKHELQSGGRKPRFCTHECYAESLRLPLALCACGCGGRVKGIHSRYRQGHNPKTKPRLPAEKRDGIWRLGLFGVKWRWYRNSKEHGTGRKYLRAREVMEAKLGRPLEKGEIVHHINGDSTDDRPENLSLFPSHSEHQRFHYERGDSGIQGAPGHIT